MTPLLIFGRRWTHQQLAGLLLITMNALDLSITYYALRHGGREANPVMGFVLARPWLAWWLKVGPIGVIAFRAGRAPGSPRFLDRFGIWIAAGICVAIVAWNLTGLIRHGAI